MSCSGPLAASLPPPLAQLGSRFGNLAWHDDTHFRTFLRTTDTDLFVGVAGVDVLIPLAPPHLPLTVVAAVPGSDASRGPPLPPAVVSALNVILRHPSNAAQPLRRRLLYLENNLTSLLREISALQSEAANAVASTSPESSCAGADASHPITASSNQLAVAAVPAGPPADTSADPWRALFMTPWLLEEQQDLESALAGSTDDTIASPTFWDSVSQRLGTKSPEQCLARFLVLRRIVRAAYPSRSAASLALGAAPPSQSNRPANSLPAASAAAEGPADASASRVGGPAFLSLPPQQQPDHPHVAGRLQRSKANERVSLAALEEELPARVLAAAPYPRGIRGYEEEEEEDDDEDAEGGGSGEDGEDATEGDARGSDAAATARAVGAPLPPDDEGSASGDEEPPSQPMFSGLTLDPAHKGHALRLGSLSLFGVGAVASSGISVNVSCTRCSMLVSARLGGVRLPSKGASSDAPSGTAASAGAEADPTRGWQAWCPRCSLLHSASLRPTLVHEGNAGLGYIDCTHCVPVGLTDASLFVTCLECGTLAAVDHFSPPETFEAACRMCYCRLRVDARVCSIESAAGSAAPVPNVGGAGDARSTPGKARRFQAGRPLPDKGACAHYRESHRWLRFPCCGQPFPCDVCHDLASDHAHEWATRMICGHCSREQPFAQSPCVACGGRLARGQGPASRFWEGGEGERRRVLLHRNDSHKYAGLAKTQSRKSSRVGPKPKA